MAKALTTSFIEKLPHPAPGKRKDYRDAAGSEGLRLRVTHSGHKSWRFETWTGGIHKVVVLGDYPTVGIKEARMLADEAREAVKMGQEPSAPKKARKAAKESVKASTFEAAATLFISRYARKEGTRNGKALRSADQMEQRLKRFVFPVLGALPLREITRSDIKGFYDAIAKNSGPVLAARLLSLIRRIYNWAANEKEWLTPELANPVKRGLITHKEVSRDRYLDDREMSLYWQATDAQGEPWATWFKLLLLLGQRRTETAGMRWNDLDLDAGLWTLPGSLTKNGKDHLVPLAPPAVALLRSLPKLRGPYVFSHTSGDKPISGISKPLARLQKTMDGVSPFRIHDIRRSCASALQELGFSMDVIGAVLNHTDRSITATYARSSLLEAKRRALEALAAKLTSTQSSNVVPLRA